MKATCESASAECKRSNERNERVDDLAVREVDGEVARGGWAGLWEGEEGGKVEDKVSVGKHYRR